jgi:hypothetical protein
VDAKELAETMENLEIRTKIFSGLKSIFDFYKNVNLET